MAATATDVVSLAEIKAELRIGVDDHDELLTSQIAAAVSFVSREIDAPLLDVTETIYVPRPLRLRPVTFRARAAKVVEAVEYWTASSSLRMPPDGRIDGAHLGRREFDDVAVVVYPPVDGWPEVLPGSMLVVEVVRGIDIDASNQALKQAVILAVRQFYDGYREIRPTEAFFALIAPFRRYD